MKKILIVDNSAWNIYNFRLPLIKKLSSSGFKIKALSPIDEYINYLNETPFVKHLPIRFLQPNSKNIIRDLIFLFELILLYKKEKPNLILHFTIKPNIYGNLAARICNIPSIAVVTGLGYTFLHQKGLYNIIPSLYKFAFKNILKLVLYNKDDQEVFLQKKLVPQHKCLIIPGSGVNTRYFFPIFPQRNDGKFVFLFIGRLLKDKGLLEFIEAGKEVCKNYPNAEFWIAGDLNDTNPSAIPKDMILAWMEGKNITYYGKLSDVRQIIGNADVLVLPSYREGVPRAILEAMSMGKPIITTDAAGCRETVEHGLNGLVVPVKNPAALALAMSYLIETPKSALEAMGQHSRNRALKLFDERIVTKSYLQLMREIFPEKKHEGTRAKSSAVF